jgi:hypothetical protein
MSHNELTANRHCRKKRTRPAQRSSRHPFSDLLGVLSAERLITLATFASMRLREVSTASIASGIAMAFYFFGTVLCHKTDNQRTDERGDDYPQANLRVFWAAEME